MNLQSRGFSGHYTLLKGPQGPPGKQGLDGIPGVPGRQGLKVRYLRKLSNESIFCKMYSLLLC